MKKNYKNLSANDITLYEIEFEMKSLKFIMCDLLVLINDCIKYNIEYESYKSSYLEFQNILDNFEVVKKKLEGGK